MNVIAGSVDWVVLVRVTVQGALVTLVNESSNGHERARQEFPLTVSPLPSKRSTAAGMESTG